MNKLTALTQKDNMLDLDLANNLTMTSDGAPATSRQSETANAEDRTATDDEQPIVNSEGRKTEDAEECKSPNSSGSSGADSSAAHRDANDDESASTSATETPVRPVEVSGVEAGASPESDSTAKKEPTDDSSSSTSAAQKNSAQDQRTAELIKKQMSEIEKEINRRIQNKNVKKVCLHHYSLLTFPSDNLCYYRLSRTANSHCKDACFGRLTPAVSGACSAEPLTDPIRTPLGALGWWMQLTPGV